MDLYNDRALMEKVFPTCWCTLACLCKLTVPYWIKPTVTVLKKKDCETLLLLFLEEVYLGTQGVSKTVLLLTSRKTVLSKILKAIQFIFSAEIRKCYWLRINNEDYNYYFINLACPCNICPSQQYAVTDFPPPNSYWTLSPSNEQAFLWIKNVPLCDV